MSPVSWTVNLNALSRRLKEEVGIVTPSLSGGALPWPLWKSLEALLCIWVLKGVALGCVL